MSHPLVIIGAGGFGREALGWVRDSTEDEVVAFYDESTPHEEVMGVPVVKSFDSLKHSDFLVAVGDPKLRKMLYEMAVAAGLHPCMPIIHPSVICGAEVAVGRGSIVCPNVVLTVNVVIHDNCLLNLACTVGHDARIRSHSVLSPGANISGNVVLEECVQVGTNAAIRERVKVGAGSVIGMGAVLLKDVPPDAVMVGNPARPMPVRPVS